ncbi:hypothetical protein [Microlunatus antarcticus]|uniref:Uncharacterized protein n=1 Tax=Microlunatus antarcticus TaxID=53388 RepID=A0A7W5JUD9_9ACTN|nr:hypothetical protein [Microlunatus antarcticus]MBB3326418.1 hypothetical protein [Microlunatus antarcticus]
MSAPVVVHAPAGVGAGAGVNAVLSSLPLSYAPGSTADGGLVVVSGSKEWPAAAAAALDAGASAVVVVHPSPADVSALQARQGLVVLDSAWAANPIIASASATFTAALPRACRLELQTISRVGTALEAALLDQLALVRTLIGPMSEVRLLTWSLHGYAAEGFAAGHPVDLELVCTGAVAEGAWVRLLTDDGSVELSIPSGVTAQPARLCMTDPHGATLAPTLYESGHRATWRRVRTLLSTQSAADDLDDFASDRETARTAFQIDED